MRPFTVRTGRIVLDQPVTADVDDIAAFCRDPLFERFLATPWPYERKHAEWFVDEHVPGGWRRAEEWTWSIREGKDQPLLGVVSARLDSGLVGYWLGAPHRGRGLMPEALDAVVTAVFERTDRDRLRWECVVGNRASLRVAEKVGFRYAGRRAGQTAARDGGPIDAWTGEIHRDDDRSAKPGWPA